MEEFYEIIGLIPFKDILTDCSWPKPAIHQISVNARSRCLWIAMHKGRYEYNSIMNSTRAGCPGTRINTGFTGLLVQQQ